jgi:hypothetical protein
MKIIKECKTCFSLERSKNGACKPCGRIKQNERNRAGRLQCHIEAEAINKKNNEIKEQAKIDGQAHYVSLTSCGRCRKMIRYVCNGACIYCN